MNRRQVLKLSAALPLASGTVAFVTADEPQSTQSADREAKLNYYAAQAALFSALAYADALEMLADLAKFEDMDLARSFIHTINREIQAVNDHSVKVVKSSHHLEKSQEIKTLRAELNEAMKAVDTAQNAVDGIGVLGPGSKNLSAHLENAAAAILSFGTEAGMTPSEPPGLEAYHNARKRG